MIMKAAALALSAFLISGSQAGGQPPSEEPRESFHGEISVSLQEIIVRVVDTWGRPILGLKPENFRVRVGREDVPVVSLDWITAGDPPSAAPEAASGSAAAGEQGDEVTVALPAPGRLVVFFVQADLHPTRISGQLRMRPRTRDLLETLHPGDQVAVVSFDSHLKLWRDFTRDRDAVHEILDKAMLFSPETDIPPQEQPSLARAFDFAAAKRAASPEKALELTARAMEPLPGEKIMVYLGWGLGRFGSGGVSMTPAYSPAVKALRAARASVFVLDVTSADSHSLAVGLEGVAADTGGLYLSTFRLPNLATEILAEAISGYYVLTVDRSQTEAGDDKLRVDLKGKRGTVLARPVALR